MSGDSSGDVSNSTIPTDEIVGATQIETPYRHQLHGRIFPSNPYPYHQKQSKMASSNMQSKQYLTETNNEAGQSVLQPTKVAAMKKDPFFQSLFVLKNVLATKQQNAHLYSGHREEKRKRAEEENRKIFRIEELEQRLSGLQGKLDVSMVHERTLLQSLGKSRQDAEENRKLLTEKITKLELDQAPLKEEIESLRTVLKQKEADEILHAKEKESILAKQSELQKETESLRAALEEENRELLTEKITKLELDQAPLKEKIESLRAVVKQKEDNESLHVKEKDSIQAKQSELQKEIESLRAALEEKEQKSIRDEEGIEQKSAKEEVILRQLAEKEHCLETANRNNQLCKDMLSSMQKKLSDQEENHQRAMKDCQEANKKLAMDLKSSNQSNLKMTTRLARVKQELETSQDLLTGLAEEQKQHQDLDMEAEKERERIIEDTIKEAQTLCANMQNKKTDKGQPMNETDPTLQTTDIIPQKGLEVTLAKQHQVLLNKMNELEESERKMKQLLEQTKESQTLICKDHEKKVDCLTTDLNNIEHQLESTQRELEERDALVDELQENLRCVSALLDSATKDKLASEDDMEETEELESEQQSLNSRKRTRGTNDSGSTEIVEVIDDDDERQSDDHEGQLTSKKKKGSHAKCAEI